ncbi:SOSS complex subunit C isoform X4 [Piliocolobus tephrosceles]|nr:PREDICTED: SOSS complex subunit C isoform X2 [Rhinopithecus bieti]XP_026312042.1 SOSS complex subunit C isoform X4 [Piliocolobus tephrosceles]XP_030775075.1 SOSS complex subunit C isoform X2 [Rhinopithecus roxellana]XP_033093686.1 SOSS complex subunit C isoform X7 [Trachypithecus francoisi]
MAANSSGQGFQNKNRVAILAELDKEKRKLLMQNQSSTNHPGASMLMHIHLGTSSLKTLHLGTLFFLFYLALTQNEENICDGKVTL